ncbi:DedA family protein [Priestia megaterium]|uniref:DedA family protein n=1 Tax=Priestia megaterium TaxID=1404 RepID=UPI001375015B|nr:DedA family protein [Priestia megaterium]
MDLTIISQYIHSYGYIVILLVLFCGIVGIPAPEESFLILLGMFIAKHQLNLYESSLFAFLGVITGMLTAYGLGRYAGTPFFDKYGKYVGLTKEKIEAASGSYHKYGIWTILFGLYIPGLRQISPYMAGISRYPFLLYLLLSVVGSLVWVLSFLILGYYVGDRVHISYIIMGAVAFFVIYLLIKRKRNRKRLERRDGQ